MASYSNQYNVNSSSGLLSSTPSVHGQESEQSIKTSSNQTSSDHQFSQYNQFNQSGQSILNSVADNVDPTQYCAGIDLGSNKITICRTSEEKNTDSIADMMDIRSIPNLIVFPQNKDQPRSFGNNASFNKAMCFDKLFNGGLTENVTVTNNDTNYVIPVYIAKSMIMGHVKKVIDYRIKNLSNTVIVPSYSDLMSNVYFETFGAKVILDDSKLNFISSSNALILSYIERYNILSPGPLQKPLINKNVIMIDMGHNKTQITLFSLEKNKNPAGGIAINCLNTYNLEGLSGKLIDDAFCLHIAEIVKNKYPGFRIDKSGRDYVDLNGFRCVCVKAKHQLSINQTVQVNFQGLDSDICITVTRQEFDDILTKNKFDDILEKTLSKIFLDISLSDHIDNLCCIEVVGGTSRIPFFRSVIQNVVLDESEVEGIDVNYTMNPDEAVGNGASFYGHLLNELEYDSKAISFYRIASDNVTLFEQQNGHEVQLFEKSEIILTNFVRNCISIGDENLYDDSDIRSARISDCEQFNIKIGNMTMRVNILYNPIKINDKSKYKSYIDVFVRYNLCDLIEVVEIKNDKNELLDFSIDILLTNNAATNVVYHDLQSIENKFKEIELKFRSNEDIIERRGAVANFMESYYLDVENINKLITTIVADQIKNQVNQSAGTVANVDSVPTSKLVCPLKEIYEFYQFCRSYGQEPVDEIAEKKHKYIETLLKDEYALQQLERAVQIVKNIMQFYQ